MVAVDDRLEIVPHGGQRQGDHAAVAALLLDPERQPRRRRTGPDPGQVGRRPHDRGDRAAASRAAQPAGRPGPAAPPTPR